MMLWLSLALAGELDEGVTLALARIEACSTTPLSCGEGREQLARDFLTVATWELVHNGQADPQNYASALLLAPQLTATWADRSSMVTAGPHPWVVSLLTGEPPAQPDPVASPPAPVVSPPVPTLVAASTWVELQGSTGWSQEFLSERTWTGRARAAVSLGGIFGLGLSWEGSAHTVDLTGWIGPELPSERETGEQPNIQRRSTMATMRLRVALAQGGRHRANLSVGVAAGGAGPTAASRMRVAEQYGIDAYPGYWQVGPVVGIDHETLFNRHLGLLSRADFRYTTGMRHRFHQVGTVGEETPQGDRAVRDAGLDAELALLVTAGPVGVTLGGEVWYGTDGVLAAGPAVGLQWRFAP